MRIDPTIEPLVRQAFTAAIRAKPEEFAQALEAFDAANGGDAMALTGAITLTVLHHEYEGGPTDVDLAEVAADVVRTAPWSALDLEDVHGTLRGLVSGGPAVGVDPRTAFISLLVTAAYLLASSTEPPKRWWTYLDEIEALLERR